MIAGIHVIMNKEAVIFKDVLLEASDLGRRMKLSKPHHSRYKLYRVWDLYQDWYDLPITAEEIWTGPMRGNLPMSSSQAAGTSSESTTPNG